MKDSNEWRTDLPPNSDMVIVAIRGIGGSITVCRGSYTEGWGKWYRAGGNTVIHPIGWAYLIKWVKPKQQVKDIK